MDAEKKVQSEPNADLVCRYCKKKIDVAKDEPGEIKLYFGDQTQVIVAHSRCFEDSIRVSF